MNCHTLLLVNVKICWSETSDVNTSRFIFFPLQYNIKHVAEPLIRRNVPHYPAELPKLNMVLPGPQLSSSVSTLPAFTVTHRGTLPAITSKKCQSRLTKVNALELNRHEALFSLIWTKVTSKSSKNTTLKNALYIVFRGKKPDVKLI